jgi:putative transposase
MKSMVSIPDVKSTFKELLEEPMKMFDLLRIDMKRSCERAVSELLKAELTHYLGRERYKRRFNQAIQTTLTTQTPLALSSTSGNSSEDLVSTSSTSSTSRELELSPVYEARASWPKKEQINYRNGYYSRVYTVKGIGNLKIKVPRDRLGLFSSQLISKYDRYDKAIERDLAMMFLSGMSTRGISLMSETLIGRKISAGEVSRVNEELLTGIEAWRTRSLKGIKVKYLIVDGVFFSMRVGIGRKKSIERIPMLVAIGVTEENQRLILCLQQGDKDTSSCWREIFTDLKRRGLDHLLVQLGIMDGLTGLEKVFKEEFPNAQVQRCQVHVSCNVLAKVPEKMKKEVADGLRDIFYASSKEKALMHYQNFIQQYESTIPSAVHSLESSIKSCLTFYSFPKEEWASLRTTNIIERLNKEFKRRTRPMEILAGEKSAYRLLCFIALKMELGWRYAPVGRKNMMLPAFEKFTQNT